MTCDPDCKMLVFAAAANLDMAELAPRDTTRAFYAGRADSLIAVAVNAPVCRVYAERLKLLAQRASLFRDRYA